MGPKRKMAVAFGVGLFLVAVTFSLGRMFYSTLVSEIDALAKLVGMLAIGMSVCFFIAQYVLSRGDPEAVREGWPLILAMNFAPLGSVLVVLVVLTPGAALGLLVVSLLTLGCSGIGAALAARSARRRLRRAVPSPC